MTQHTLFDTAPSPHRAPDKPDPKAELPPASKFAQFCHDTPWFIDELIYRARAHRDAGNKRCSMKLLFEQIRPALRAVCGQKIKGVGKVGLNNDFSAPATRLVIERAPDLEGFFEMRGRK